MAFDFDKDGNFIEPPKAGRSFDFDSDGNYLSGDPKPEPEGGLIASAKNAFGAMVKGAGQAASDFIPGVDNDNAVKRYGQGIIDANPTAVHSLSDIADKPLTAGAEAVGNAAGSVGQMLGVRAVGQGITALSPLTGPAAPAVALLGQAVSWLGPAAVAALPSYGGIRDKQILNDPQNEADWRAKTIATLGAATVGAIESKFGPQQWALSAMTKEGRAAIAEKFAETTLAKGIGFGALKGAAIEGAEELAQNPIEQLAGFDDPRTPENLKETAFGGAMGAIGGGVLGGGFGAAFRSDAKPKVDPVPDILDSPNIDDAINTFVAANQEITPAAIDAGQQFKDLGITAPADDLAMQRVQSEREGAAASQARDQRLQDAGQAWQDLGVTNPSDDLQAQRMGLRENQDVSTNPDLQQLPAGSTGRGSIEPGVGLETALGRDDVPGPRLGAGLPESVPAGESVAPANRVDADAVEPAKTWFGRKGDGYVTEGDAVMALPSRQKIEPDLNWRVEAMPSGKFRLAGYADAVVKSGDAANIDSVASSQNAPAEPNANGTEPVRVSGTPSDDRSEAGLVQDRPNSFDFTRNADNTLTVFGDTAEIRAAGITGITKFIDGKPGAIVVSVSNAPKVAAQLEASRVQNNPASPANIEAAPAQARAETPAVDGRAPGQAAEPVAGSGAVQAVAPGLVASGPEQDAVDIDNLVDEFEATPKGAKAVAKGRQWVADTFHSEGAPLAENPYDPTSSAGIIWDRVANDPTFDAWKKTNNQFLKDEGLFNPDRPITGFQSGHKDAVSIAVQQGKDVPREVLAEYPDLKAVPSQRLTTNQPQGTPNVPAPAQAIEAKPTAPAQAPTDQRLIPVSQRTPKPIDQPAPEVSRYTGKYGKGMGHDAAKLEASRLNRTSADKAITYTAEEHNDPKLENPWAVVGRKVEQYEVVSPEVGTNLEKSRHHLKASEMVGRKEGAEAKQASRMHYEKAMEFQALHLTEQKAEETKAKRAATIAAKKPTPATDSMAVPSDQQQAKPDVTAEPVQPEAKNAGSRKTIAVTKIGDFYEVIGEDAKEVAKTLDLTLTKSRSGDPMVGWPYHANERMLKTLSDAGMDAGTEQDNAQPADPIATAVQAMADAVKGLQTALAPKEAAQPAAKAAPISDFGQKIGGAKKDTWTGFKDDLSSVKDDDIASRKLSEIWPAPDYQKMIDDGMDEKSVAVIRALRDEIPSKPRTEYKVKRWAEQVKTMRDLAANVLNEKDTVAAIVAQLERGTSQMKGIAGRVELYMAVGHGKSLEGIRLAQHHYSLYRGRENVRLWVVERDAAATMFSNFPQELATGDTKEQAIDAFRAKYDTLDATAAVKKAAFVIFTKGGGDKGFYIGKKIGRNIADMAGPFATPKEAREYRENNLAELDAKLEKYKEIPKERRDTNEPRVGEDMRNGQDVTPEMFSEAFGFKGVEFGNWVEQKRRQKDLNDAFDALMDMAAIMGVPAKAISLNGELGLAFGARGSGGVNPASAHYETDKIVINLTKREGAGSLGHEFWHALDNYFSRMRQNKTSPFMTTATDVGLSAKGSQYVAYPGVRKEMIDAFGEVVRSIKQTAIKARSSKIDAKRTKEYWTTGEEMAARAFESYLISKLHDQNASNDYLANVIDQKTWDTMAAMGMENEDSYPYPTAGEMPVIRAGFDKFFQTLETKEDDAGNVAMYRNSGPNGYATSNTINTPSDYDGKAIVDRVNSKLNGPQVILVDTFADLPANVRDAATRNGMDSAAGITIGKNRVYIVHDQNPSAEYMEATIVHELYGHIGIRALFGQEVYSRLNKLSLSIGATKFKEIAEKYGLGDGGYFEAADSIASSASQKALRRAGGMEELKRAWLMEEALAHIAEKDTGTLKQKALELIGAIRAWLRDHGFMRLEKMNMADIAAILKAARMAVENASVDVDVPMFSFAGRQAATANMRAMATAEQRLNNGDNAETVRNETGWSKGVDGKWRFEISDADAKLNDAAWNKLFTNTFTKNDKDASFSLGHLLDHPKLFAAYPALRSMRVFMNDGAGATYHDDGDGTRFITVGAKAGDRESILLHEIQHGIQFIEGFATGGSAKAFAKELPNGDFDNGFESYRKLAGEVEARNTEARRPLTDEERRLVPPYSTQDVPDRDVIVTYKGKEMHSRSVITGQTLPQTWQAPDATKLDDFIYSMQDKHVDTKRITQAVRAAIGNIADNINPYLQEELYHGRAAMATKEFLEQQVRPLLTDLQARGIDMSDFEEYLHNRHAERRNVQVAKVNPNMPDGGSGINTADARAYLAGLTQAKKRAYEALAKRVDQINRDTRALLVSSGLEKQSTIDAWQAAYGDEYVPLMREEMDNGMGIGQGFSVRGGSSKRAMGSNKPVANIIANIALQREKAITRSEKQRIGHALYGMVLSAPNDDFWLAIDPALQQDPAQILATATQLVSIGMSPADADSIAREPTTRYINPQTGLVEERINPALRSADNALAVRIDGEDKYVFFNAKDERAMRMAKALKNLDADQLGSVMGTVAKMTRYFSAVNTQYNPIFGVTNITRDVQTAMLNLESTALKGHKADVMKHILPALRGIYIDLRDHRAGKQPTSAYAQIFEEFQREGGATGYRDMYANAQERADAIKDELADINAGKLKQLGKGVMGWLSDYNESMENAVRVSAYKVGVEQGLTKQQAASLAKNLTVNFNRKGQVALQAGALYAFFNASVQGTARIAETLFEGGKLSAVGKKIITGGLLLGSMQALLFAAAGFDDEEPQDFVRERNLVIPIGDKKYVTIPMPLGFHVLPNIARIPTEWVMGGFRNTPKRIGQMVGLFADAFNPIGSAGLSLQTLTPTIIDPLAALSENKDFTGRPIAKKDFDPMRPTAGHTRAKDSATPWAKFISQAVNFATGGTDYKPGLASPTPDQIDYLIGQVFGGVGREIGKATQVIGGNVSGEDVPLHKIPLVGRFVGTTEGQSAEASRFYNNLRSIGEHKVELDGLRHDRKGAEAAEYFRENREAMLVPMATKIQSEVSKLNKLKRELLSKDASPERIKIIDAQITQKMALLNQRVKQMRSAEAIN